MMNPDLTVAAEGELYESALPLALRCRNAAEGELYESALPLALRCQNEELDEDDDDENDREFDEMAHFRCMLPY